MKYSSMSDEPQDQAARRRFAIRVQLAIWSATLTAGVLVGLLVGTSEHSAGWGILAAILVGLVFLAGGSIVFLVSGGTRAFNRHDQ